MASNLLVKPSVIRGRPSSLLTSNRGGDELVSKQLVSINQNIIAVGNNIQTVASALVREDRLSTTRIRGEKRRRIRLAEKESFGGAEKSLEGSVVAAVKRPINVATKTIAGPLESLKRALLLLFGGWLTDKLIKLFDKEGGTFNERLKKFGGEIIKGVGLAVGVMSILDGNFFRIAKIMGSLAFKIGKFLVLSPFKLLKSLFKLRPGSGKGKFKGPGRVPRSEKGKPKVKGLGKGKIRTRLGRLFGRALLGLGGTLEFKGGREEGYDKKLSALKSLLVSGAAYGTGALVAKGLALTGAGLVFSIPAGVGAASFAGTESAALFDKLFGQFKQEGQGTFELYDREGSPMKDYKLQIFEGGQFEVKKTGMFQNPFGAPILDSRKIISGEQTISPDGKNAELLEAALRQVTYMTIDDTPDAQSRRNYYLDVAEKAFGKLDINPFDRNQSYNDLISGNSESQNNNGLVTTTPNPEKQSMIQGLVRSGFDFDDASNIASIVFDSNDSNTSSANIGVPTLIPVIPTKNPDNPFNDLARSIYNVRF